MATLYSILSTAASGVSVAQTAAALVSRNIANANTAGYAREILPLSAAFGGLGVTAGPPEAVRAFLLERALQGAEARVAYHEGQVPHLTLAEAAVNDLDGVGLGPSLDDFRAALAGLAANPSGDAERNTLLATGRTLGAAFASTHAQLAEVTENTTEEAVTVASQVNTIATQIALIDQRIRSARQGEELNTYIAQRTALVQSLSTLVHVDVRQRADGSLHVSTGGGTSLVEAGKAARMVVEIGQPPARSLSVKFEKDGGSVIDAIAGSDFGGKLGGLIAAHEETLAPAMRDLDQLAFDFMTAFNTTHAAGFTPTGAAGGSFWSQPAAVEGAAAKVSLAVGLEAGDIAAALSPNAPGDNGNLLLLDALMGETGAIASGASLPESWRRIGASVSQALAGAEAGVAFEAASRDQISNLLAAETGVSIDEEMFNLTQAQTALEASSRVLATAQQMTDTVLDLIG